MSESLPAWIRTRLGDRTPGSGTGRVLHALATHPRKMSFASTAEAAALAGVNAATVVRAAQLLGFGGWPQLRAEVRSRFLSGLSASAVLAEHAPTDEGPVGSSLRRDIQNLHDLALLIDDAQIERVARLMFDARVTVVLGSGSYAGPGIQLSHLAQLIGHDVRLHQVAGTGLYNAVNLLGPQDCLVAFHLWRSPWEVINAVRTAAAAGVRVVLVSDQTDEVSALADEVLLVPSEGASMFPSLTATTTVVQAVFAAMVAVDPAGAAAATDRVEEIWRRYSLFPERSSKPQ
ncbi:hypothetical protein [Georgenia sp. SUBG003]|uniref:MurR/RpiR family transcriptional regulator n=1 Tax=Georgenia sp. SUBG003 TaxID=1497974 RepID=UPI0005BD3395